MSKGRVGSGQTGKASLESGLVVAALNLPHHVYVTQP